MAEVVSMVSLYHAIVFNICFCDVRAQCYVHFCMHQLLKAIISALTNVLHSNEPSNVATFECL